MLWAVGSRPGIRVSCIIISIITITTVIEISVLLLESSEGPAWSFACRDGTSGKPCGGFRIQR